MPASSDLHPSEAAAPARFLVAGLGGACVLLGTIVVAGWYLHLHALVQLRPTLPPMQFNTALCFVMAGLALAAWAFGRSARVIPVLGGLIIAMSALTLAEYLFHLNLGIDQALFQTYIVTEVSDVGRMSPVSALCFTLAGAALLALELREAARCRGEIVGSIASIIISVSMVAAAGYIFGLPGTYGWGQLTRVAAHTIAGLSLMGTALLIIAWSISLHPGERTPRWLPAPLALGIFTGSLVLYFALDGRQNDQIAQTVQTDTLTATNLITVRLESRMRAFVRMARRWEFSGAPSRAAWEDDATAYCHDFPDIQALEWIDAGHRIRWIVPLAGNESKLNLDLTEEPYRRVALDNATRGHQPVITRVVSLFRGGLGFVVYVPMVVNGRPDGCIAAVFNAEACLRRFLPPGIAAGESVEIFDGPRLFFQRDVVSWTDHREWVAQKKIELPGASWSLWMWPTQSLSARLDSPLPGVVLCAGMLCSLLLGAVCFFSQRASRHATETSRANTALKSALDKVRTLEGLLPICSSCKRVRDDTGYWSQIDTYISHHTNASLSHGYCPECAAKAFRDCGFEVPPEVEAAIAAGNFE